MLHVSLEILVWTPKGLITSRGRFVQPSVFCLFVLLLFTSRVNSYGHGGTVSSPNHTFSGQA